MSGAPFAPDAPATMARVAAATHVGSVRERNEDSFGVSGLELRLGDGVVTDRETALPFVAVVADGLGGHRAGDQASRLAVETVLASSPFDAESLTKAIHGANEAIVDAMSEDADNVGMASTIAAVLVADTELVVGNVGDSAVFQMTDGRLMQLSTDDVPPGSAALPGVPSSIVTQTLGGSAKLATIRPHSLETPRQASRLLLCSDGLTNYVPRSDIGDVLAQGSPAEAVECLIALALAAGGRDNVTVVVADIDLQPSVLVDALASRGGDLDIRREGNPARGRRRD